MFMPWDRIKETGVCLSSQYGSSYSIHWMMRVNTIFCFERRSLSFEASQPTWTGRLMVAIRFVLLYVHPRACWHIGLPTTAKEIIIRNCPDVCIFFFLALSEFNRSNSTTVTAKAKLPASSHAVDHHDAAICGRWMVHGKFSRQIEMPSWRMWQPVWPLFREYDGQQRLLIFPFIGDLGLLFFPC